MEKKVSDAIATMQQHEAEILDVLLRKAEELKAKVAENAIPVAGPDQDPPDPTIQQLKRKMDKQAVAEKKARSELAKQQQIIKELQPRLKDSKAFEEKFQADLQEQKRQHVEAVRAHQKKIDELHDQRQKEQEVAGKEKPSRQTELDKEKNNVAEKV